jgi:hypothetical protein
MTGIPFFRTIYECQPISLIMTDLSAVCILLSQDQITSEYTIFLPNNNSFYFVFRNLFILI